MPSDKRLQSMRSFHRQSTTEEFVRSESPLPPVAKGGARIRVCFAGACYTNGQVVNSGQKRPRMMGIMDTSLFPGFEVSGILDELCPTADVGSIKVGDHVIVYPTDEEESTESGYSDYISVKDASNLVHIPETMPLDLGAILPCGALAAYSAVQRVKPFIQDKLESTTGIINVLIVGAGGLGLWTLRIAEYVFNANNERVRLTVADSNVDKLMIAKEHGCYDVIHCDESQHEEYIAMRIRNVCKGGVDAVVDFVSSARTVRRSCSVLREGGVIVVGGNSKYDVPLNLYSLAMHNQSVLGVHRGTRKQLQDLVHLVATEKIQPPIYSVFPVDEANRVFQQLSRCRINGRAVLRVCSVDDDAVFNSSSSESLVRYRSSVPSALPESPEPMNCETTDGSDSASPTAAPSRKFFLPPHSP